MFKLMRDKKYLDKLKEQAAPAIRADRARYAPILKIALDYVQKNENSYIDIFEICDDDFDLEKNIACGATDKFNFFSTDAHEAAKEISAIICKEIGDKLRLNIVSIKQEYLIEYDFRRLITIFQISGTIPLRKIKKYKILPAMLKQAQLLYDIIDVSNFSSWEETILQLDKIDKFIKIENIQEIDPDDKTLCDIRSLILEFLKGSKHVMVSTNIIYPLEIIFATNVDNLLGEIKTYLDKYTNLSIYFKPINMNIPRHPAFMKYGIYVSTHNKPIFYAYNLAALTLVPFVMKEYRMAAPVVMCFINLANIWNSHNLSNCTRKHEIDEYRKALKDIKIVKYKYTGTYVNTIIKKKIDQLQSRKFSSEKLNYYCLDFSSQNT